MIGYLVQLADDADTIVEALPYKTVDQAQQARDAIVKQLEQSEWMWNVNGTKRRIKTVNVAADTKFKTPWWAHPAFVFGVPTVVIAAYFWWRRSNQLSGIEDDELIGGGSILHPSILAKRVPKVAKAFVPSLEPEEPKAILAPVKALKVSPTQVPPKQSSKKVVLPPPDVTDVPIGERKLSGAQQERLKLLSTLVDRFHEGKASPTNADSLCGEDDELGQSLCEAWCYRIGYSTGFCVAGHCHCSGLVGK